MQFADKTILFWGTYDTGKPRVRMLLAAARQLGYEVHEVHSHVWEGVEDKSRVGSLAQKARMLGRYLLAWPGLLYRYLRAPKHRHVVVPYLGVFDVIVLWPWAKLRGAAVHWDVFLSVYDTLVNDRKLVSRWNPLAAAVYCAEWLASRLADTRFLDTPAHAGRFAALYRLEAGKTGWVPVGVEVARFPRVGALERIDPDRIKVLFYGQFTPLHGIDTVLNAALSDTEGRIDWLIVGTGQLADALDARIAAERLDRVRRIDWVEYDKLIELIGDSDICLGVFGSSRKADCVIPNKVYQIMAAGKPMVTADTAGVRSLDIADNAAVRLPRAGDAAALLSCVYDLANAIRNSPALVFGGTRLLPVVGVDEVAWHLKKSLAVADGR